jgi:hypothetical protein
MQPRPRVRPIRSNPARRLRILSGAAVLAALASLAGEDADATPTGSLSFYCGTPLDSMGSTSGDLPLSLVAANQSCAGSGTVVPGAITLHGHQSLSTQNGANSVGTMEFTDIVFSASGGAPGTASVAVTVHVDGVVSNASFSTSAWANTLTVGEKKTSDPGSSCCLPGVFDYLLASGGTLGAFSADYTSPAFLVELNTPWTLLIGSHTTTGSRDAQISSTLGFEIGATVFVLPAGVTANSIDGQIVNNVFVGAAVPEPATAVLLASGVAALAVVRLARRSRRV